MMPLPPYVRSVIGRGGRPVMSGRNFSSSVSGKASQTVFGMSVYDFKQKLASTGFVSGWALWLGLNYYEGKKRHEEYVIPAMQARQEAIEEYVVPAVQAEQEAIEEFVVPAVQAEQEAIEENKTKASAGELVIRKKMCLYYDVYRKT